MATPRNDSYTSTGVSIYAGQQPLPSWVPTPGTFADISLNTLASAKPTGWPSSESAGPFANWAGGVRADDFGTDGGYVVHGSGHLSAGSALWAGVWVFDVGTRLWVGRNVPSQPLLEDSNYNGYFESTTTATTGHTYAPHTYHGMVYQSAANGGGASGSLIRNFHAGAGITFPRCVHRFDLSSATAPPTRVIANVATTGSSNNYPMACVDDSRGGYWLTAYNGLGPAFFVKFSDWSMVQSDNIQYNQGSDGCLVTIPAPYDVLIALHRREDGTAPMQVRVAKIVAGMPNYMALVPIVGAAPAELYASSAGGRWSTLLNCIVVYSGRSSNTVYKLTPPAVGSDMQTATWTWSSETLAGVGGAVAQPAASSQAGDYARFIEFPKLRCFLWASGINAPVQAWRLQGM